jgi:hypothetical protein
VTSPFLRATNKRWADPPGPQHCSNIVELVSAASRDTDLTGVGSSPWPGDMGRTGIAVPAAATTSQRNRYLFRLCGFEIPSGKAAILRGIRQLATIRHQGPPTGLGDLPIVVEREVVSPLWSFLDGNISWHLRRQPNQFSSNTQSPTQIPGTSFNMHALDTALLCQVGGLPPAYSALNAGIPPGVGIDVLGTWRDIRFPWENTDWSLSRLFRGPGTVVLYASVAQTDPTARPLYPGVAGERPEDQFVSNFQDTAVYGRVAGSLIVELLPCCPESGAVPPGS